MKSQPKKYRPQIHPKFYLPRWTPAFFLLFFASGLLFPGPDFSWGEETGEASRTTITQTENELILDASSLPLESNETLHIVQMEPTSLAKIQITGRQPVHMKGRIIADGRLEIVADSQFVLENSASIEAKELHLSAPEIITHGKIYAPQGKIILEADELLKVHGSLDASGKEKGTKGGTIHALGNKVGLFDTAKIDVSGYIGGGTALIGGDYQGKNPDIQNAFRTYVGKDVTIMANALTTGNGGKVIFWADETTVFYGNISATGGSVSGDGGFVEVSGKADLMYAGLADLTAVNGSLGSLLLDPTNITIGTDDTDGSQITGDQTLASAESVCGGTCLISASQIVTQLNTAAVSLAAIDSITVSTAIDASGNTNSFGLTLATGNGINIDADITVKGALTITPNTDNSGTGNENLVIASGVTLTSGGLMTLFASAHASHKGVNASGVLTLNAVAGIIINDDLTGSGGDITIDADTDNATSGTLTFAAGFTNSLSTGVLTLDATTGGITALGALTLSSGDNITINDAITAAGAIILNSKDRANINADVTSSGNITIDGNSDNTGGNNEDIIFASGVTLTSSGGSITLMTGGAGDKDITASGSLTLNATAGVTINVGLTGSGAFTVNADTDGNGGLFSLPTSTDVINVGANAISITSDTISLTGDLTGQSTVLLQPSAAATTIGIGPNNPSGTFSANETLIGNLTNGFSAITIGRSDGTGAVNSSSSGGTLTINDPITIRGGAMVLRELSAGSNNVTLTSSSTIDDDAANTAVTTTGTLTMTSSGAIGSATTFNTAVATLAITGTGGNNATIDNGNTNIDLAGITMGTGNLSITTGGIITDSAATTGSGTASFTTNQADKDITLDTTTNAFSGAVSFSTSGTGDVTLDNGNISLNLGTVGIGQNFSARAGGTITDSGVITVGGTASFTTDVDDQAITLDGTGNVISGNITVATQGASGDVTIDNTNQALGIQGTVNGNLVLQAGAAITDSSTLTVSGTSSFTVDSGTNNITLDTSALTGAVSVSTTGASNFTLDNGTTAPLCQYK